MTNSKIIKFIQAICKTGLDNGNMYGFFRKIGNKVYATDTKRAIIAEDLKIAGVTVDGFYVWQRDLPVKIDEPAKFPDIERLFIGERPKEIFSFDIPQIKSKDKTPLSFPSLRLGHIAGEISVDCNLIFGFTRADKISFSTPSLPALFESEGVKLLVMPTTA